MFYVVVLCYLVLWSITWKPHFFCSELSVLGILRLDIPTVISHFKLINLGQPFPGVRVCQTSQPDPGSQAEEGVELDAGRDPELHRRLVQTRKRKPEPVQEGHNSQRLTWVRSDHRKIMGLGFSSSDYMTR